jgi:8-oxo-dGTP diphosphatase
MKMRHRPAARLLVTDPLGHVLLFRFDHRTGALAGTSYWATPGGGVELGETYETAAIRELNEETGILIINVGPVIARREIVFQLANGERVLEVEQYFHISVPNKYISLNGWKATERETMTGYRWWTLPELAQTREQISPDNLIDLLKGCIAQSERC